jgi:hypothetical protein
LEDHAHALPLPGDFCIREVVEPGAFAAVADQFGVDPDGAAIDLFELIDAAQKRALA